MTLTPPQRRTLSWIVIAVLVMAFIWLLGPVLTPFVIATVLAYALHPAVEALARRRVPRVVAVALIELAVIAAGLAVVLLIVPVMAKELPLLRGQIPLLADRLNHGLSPWLEQYGIHVSLDTASIKDFVLKYLDANLDDWTAKALSSVRIGGSIVLALVGNAFLVPVVLFYLLMDWSQLVQRATALVPPRMHDSVRDFTTECDTTLGQYLRGQLLVMIVMAAYYSIGLTLFGFDLGLPVGTFTGLAVFIPYVGFGIGVFLALLTGLLQFASWYAVVAVAVVYGIGQVIESFFLTPRLVGERIGMNPLTVIFALLAFGQLFGFVGVLIALPVSALLVVAVRRVRAAYLESPLYRG
ncbi:MAG: AI-2E family transporter [Proteobacteria bacterium]|nr:AI-2E family transporter [Pseudomonadota bacterium]